MKTQQEIQSELTSLTKWMSLSDMVSYMVSSDYKDRMKAEAYQLAIRINKLTLALKKSDDPLMIKQLAAMKEYFNVLTQRMEKEGVNS